STADVSTHSTSCRHVCWHRTSLNEPWSRVLIPTISLHDHGDHLVARVETRKQGPWTCRQPSPQLPSIQVPGAQWVKSPPSCAIRILSLSPPSRRLGS